MRSACLAVSLGLMALPLAAEVEIRQSGDRVSLEAVSAPVAEILDRLALQTGMKVVYDAQLPRQLITAKLEQRTPAEAVLGIMEGLGFNYALVMDAGGEHVDQLLILGPVGLAPPAPAPPPTPAPPQRRDRLEAEPDQDVDQAPEDEFEERNVPPPAPANPAPNAPAGMPAPAPPDYPSSSFTPKLPVPATPPPPSPPPGGGGRIPVPQPSPTPNPH